LIFRAKTVSPQFRLLKGVESQHICCLPFVKTIRTLISSDSQAREASRLLAELDKALSSEQVEDISDPKLSDRLRFVLDRLQIAQKDSVILVEFGAAYFSNTESAAGVIENAFETVEDTGAWHSIIFQGTSYPEKNPANHGEDELVPRNEWIAWSRAVRFSKHTPQHLVFGDYAADCATMKFGKSGAPAIRHYRYTTAKHWFVCRGAKTDPDTVVMRDVCQRILNSGHFAGRQFSVGDDYIYCTAVNTDGPGNSTTWRAVNTNHHVTRVARDTGSVRGMTFRDGKVDESGTQLELLQTRPIE
jgi:T4 beta protein